jgi:hypothetical protein
MQEPQARREQENIQDHEPRHPKTTEDNAIELHPSSPSPGGVVRAKRGLRRSETGFTGETGGEEREGHVA